MVGIDWENDSLFFVGFVFVLKQWEVISLYAANQLSIMSIDNNTLPLPAKWRNPTGIGPVPSLSVRSVVFWAPHRAPHPQPSFPEARPWDCLGFQNLPPLPVLRCYEFARSIRGLPCWSFRRHQLVRQPRQACDHHAKGHPIGPFYPWRTRLIFLPYPCIRAIPLRPLLGPQLI